MPRPVELLTIIAALYAVSDGPGDRRRPGCHVAHRPGSSCRAPKPPPDSAFDHRPVVVVRRLPRRRSWLSDSLCERRCVRALEYVSPGRAVARWSPRLVHRSNRYWYLYCLFAPHARSVSPVQAQAHRRHRRVMNVRAPRDAPPGNANHGCAAAAAARERGWARARSRGARLRRCRRKPALTDAVDARFYREAGRAWRGAVRFRTDDAAPGSRAHRVQDVISHKLANHDILMSCSLKIMGPHPWRKGTDMEQPERPCSLPVYVFDDSADWERLRSAAELAAKPKPPLGASRRR